MPGGVFGTRQRDGRCLWDHDTNDPANIWIGKRFKDGRKYTVRICKSCAWYRKYDPLNHVRQQLYFTKAD